MWRRSWGKAVGGIQSVVLCNVWLGCMGRTNTMVRLKGFLKCDRLKVSMTCNRLVCGIPQVAAEYE
jgi:hypothetical protein